MKPGHPVNSLCRPALVTSFRESVQQVWASTATLRFRGDLVSVGYEWAVSSVGAGSGQWNLFYRVQSHHRCVPGDFRPFHASTHSQALCRGSSPYPTAPKRLPDDSLTMLSQCYYCVKAPITATWDSTSSARSDHLHPSPQWCSDMQAASLKMNILSRGWTDLQGSDSFKSYVIYITV